MTAMTVVGAAVDCCRVVSSGVVWCRAESSCGEWGLPNGGCCEQNRCSPFCRDWQHWRGGPSTKCAPTAEKDSIAARTFASPFAPATESWTDGWRRAEIPAANGHSNARAIAKLQAPLACKGSAFGVDLFSKETAESVMQARISGTDLVLGVPIAFGLGFGLNSEVMPLSPNQNTCFWGGWGGSSVVVDQDASLSASFVMNKMFPGLMGDTRSFGLLQAVYQSL